MIIYSVTVSLDPEIEEDWKNWMLNKHIPDVMNTGHFIERRMTKVLQGVEENGISYNIQYLVNSEEELQNYQENHAPKLQQEHGERYKDKFIAFRTLLQVIE